jgi:hypothetical protein
VSLISEQQTFLLAASLLALTISMAICAIGNMLATWLNIGNFFILIITVLALTVANFAKSLVKRMNAEFRSFAVELIYLYDFYVIQRRNCLTYRLKRSIFSQK